MATSRKNRGLSQRILYLSHTTALDGTTRAYKVLGATGSEYEVTIGNKLWCTCPDSTYRYKRCKHMFFVLGRVLGVTDSTLLEKETYTSAEIMDIYTNAPDHILPPLAPSSSVSSSSSSFIPFIQTSKQSGDSVLSDLVSRLAEQKTEDHIDTTDTASKTVQRRPFKGETCAICLEDMRETEELLWCEVTCGKSVHHSCFARYLKHTRRNSCVHCRSSWVS